MLGHAGHNQCPNSIRCLVWLELEHRINVDYFAADRYDPCSSPCLAAPLALVPSAVYMVVDRGWDGGKAMLLTRDDVPRFYNEINDLQRKVIASKERKVSKFPVCANEHIKCWASPLGDVVLN